MLSCSCSSQVGGMLFGVSGLLLVLLRNSLHSACNMMPHSINWIYGVVIIIGRLGYEYITKDILTTMVFVPKQSKSYTTGICKYTALRNCDAAPSI